MCLKSFIALASKLREFSNYLPIFALFQYGSKPTNRLRDLQEIQNNVENVRNHHRNISKKFQKDILYITGEIFIFV